MFSGIFMRIKSPTVNGQRWRRKEIEKINDKKTEATKIFFFSLDLFSRDAFGNRTSMYGAHQNQTQRLLHTFIQNTKERGTRSGKDVFERHVYRDPPFRYAERKTKVDSPTMRR